MAKLYGSEKRLASIGSYTLETTSGFDPAVVSVDLTTFKNFLNSQTNYLETINSDATFSRILISVAYADGTYRFRITLVTGGTGTALQSFVDENHSTLVSTVQSATGISLSPTFGEMTQTSFIVPADEVYEYKAKEVTKLYGSALYVSSVESFTKEDPDSWVTASDPVNDSVFLSKVNESFPGVNADAEAENDYLNGRVLLYMDNNVSSSGQFTFRVSYGLGDSTSTYRIVHLVHPSDVTSIVSLAAQWGIDINANNILSGTACRLTIICETERKSKEVKKLYGSVNGQTKLIYQAQ